MANLLEAVGASLEEVRLEAIKEGTFNAVVKPQEWRQSAGSGR